jgi:hypothetical protein
MTIHLHRTSDGYWLEREPGADARKSRSLEISNGSDCHVDAVEQLRNGAVAY